MMDASSCSEPSIEVLRNVPAAGGIEDGGRREAGMGRQEGAWQPDRHYIADPSPFTPPPVLFAPLITSTPKVNAVAAVRKGVSGNGGAKLSSEGSKKSNNVKTAEGEEKAEEPDKCGRERDGEKPKSSGQKGRVMEPKRGGKEDVRGAVEFKRGVKKGALPKRGRKEDRRTMKGGTENERAAEPKRGGKKGPAERRKAERRTVKGGKENGKAVEPYVSDTKKARLKVVTAAGQSKDGSEDASPKATRSKLEPLQERPPNLCCDSSTTATESTLMNQLLDFDEIGFEASQNLQDMFDNETSAPTPLPYPQHHTPTAVPPLPRPQHHTPTAVPPLPRPQYPDPITVPIPQWYLDKLEAKHRQSMTTAHLAQSERATVHARAEHHQQCKTAAHSKLPLSKRATAHARVAQRRRCIMAQNNRDILTAGLSIKSHAN